MKHMNTIIGMYFLFRSWFGHDGSLRIPVDSPRLMRPPSVRGAVVGSYPVVNGGSWLELAGYVDIPQKYDPFNGEQIATELWMELPNHLRI